MKTRSRISLIILLSSHLIHGQLIPEPEIKQALLKQQWNASWVSVPDTSPFEYGVYFFRNKLLTEEVPSSFIIHISADNRYKLYINGELTGLGPARGDVDNWIYDTYDIAPYLVEGVNYIAAEVWNFGVLKPLAQISLHTGFIVQGDDEQTLNTPGTWECLQARAFQPVLVNRKEIPSYYVVGPGDRLDGNSYPWKWRTGEQTEQTWLVPEALRRGTPKGTGYEITHALVPRTIPAMELSMLTSPVIRKVDGTTFEESTINGYTIPPDTSIKILLDQRELVTAYPEIIISGGKGAKISLTYAEALYDLNGKKQHRDSVNQVVMRGNSDLFISDGKQNRDFTTLWFRTFRYIELEVETREDSLTIQSFTSLFTAYPFEEKAWFKSDQHRTDDIWNTGWRTSRLCANELFFDCPYYEQAQYAGDTRIQALISLYVSGDDRLMKKAIRDFYNSMIPEGLTRSRYPVNTPQVIPPYSLFWISMIHDYLWHRSDYMFTSNYLVSIQHILQWFENRIDQETGMLGSLEYWPFADWTTGWPEIYPELQSGVPPGAAEGNSALITLQYVMTLDQAADIFNYFGLEALASSYLDQADKLIEAVWTHCWDPARGLFADTPEKRSYSQHTNSLAVITNAIPKADQPLLMETVLRDTQIVEASLYFRYYVNRAAISAGLGNKYMGLLEPWEQMVNQGLTTFAEITDTRETRSDCHAWSSSPLYEFLSTVAGIRPAEPGFRSVIIEPHPGTLKEISAGIPHERGVISLDLQFDNRGGVKGAVILPDGLSGVFIWDGQTVDLQAGEQRIAMQSLDSRFRF